mgnify:CR=1 FL=1
MIMIDASGHYLSGIIIFPWMLMAAHVTGMVVYIDYPLDANGDSRDIQYILVQSLPICYGVHLLVLLWYDERCLQSSLI